MRINMRVGWGIALASLAVLLSGSPRALAGGPFCGDAVVQTGEECDNGMANGPCAGCELDCTLSQVCGNGVAECFEECDDANTMSGDGCSNVCVIEFCGDGVVNNGPPGPGEQCDDGGTMACDGCSATCQTEVDTDGDGTFDPCDADDDNDGVDDGADPAPLDPDICGNIDGDDCDDCSVGSDDFGAMSDQMPFNDGADADGDGICDDDDADIDNDCVLNAADPDDFDPNVCGDSDGDDCDDCSGPGGDGFGVGCDNFPLDDGPDQDGDGLCDDGDPDIDGDGVANDDDNCPLVSNADQADRDEDGDGDVCDPPTVMGTNVLYLESEAGPQCLGETGDIIQVKVWMLNIDSDPMMMGNQPVSGFQAFLTFNDDLLDYLPPTMPTTDGSSYTATPFPTHVPAAPIYTPGSMSTPGKLSLSGSADINDPGTAADSLLATLRFMVVSEACQDSAIAYDPDPVAPMDPFQSELSTPTGAVATTLLPAGGVVIEDTMPPTVSGPAGPIMVIADAGGCDAEVTYTVTASDNCDGDVMPDCTPPSGSTFPSGPTMVSCTATDDCGNVSAPHTFTVDVQAVNEVTATVVLDDVDATVAPMGMVTRCIKFIAKNGSTCAAPVFVEMTFTGGPIPMMPGTGATATATFEVPCGDWDELCAKDEQHTLYDTQPLSISGTSFSATSSLVLLGGDTDNDSDVDILDVTYLLFRINDNLLAATPQGACGPWSLAERDADFSNNGNIGTEDFSIQSANWQASTTCGCASAAQGGGPDRRTSIPTSELDPIVASGADLNRDGVIDTKDVEAFESRHQLSPRLSRVLRRSAEPRGK